MLYDKENLFADKQALAAASTPSQNVVQVQAGVGDYGVGDDMAFFVNVDGAPATILTVTLQHAADEAFTQDVHTLASLTVPAALVAKGGLVAGGRVPYHATGPYLRMTFAGPAAGTVTAGLAKDVPGGIAPTGD